MIDILLSGCNGKMGQVITRLTEGMDDLKIAAGYDKFTAVKNNYPVFSDLKDCKVKIDVMIDFSNPEALDSVLDYAVSRKVPLVLATTGLNQIQQKSVENASKQIAVFMTANMSLGINLLIDLVKKAAKLLEENFDIEIVEKHHNQKLDAPSGTALTIADEINSALENKCEYIYDRHSRRKKRGKKEIGIHAVRGGTIVGEHSVIFAGNDEIIEINHTAMSKDVFGIGALRAAKFMSGKEHGIYGMKELISDK
ncbi:MAG: 4-hydroxy-tetrahydrodipicolinate reductase [Bacillota bacterium]|nr:4-hydroxy-tetrahydrodipicolinate reductase [Bacillota bacterium]